MKGCGKEPGFQIFKASWNLRINKNMIKNNLKRKTDLYKANPNLYY